MNAILFHMASHKKNHHPKMTKTLETNITSDKGEEKSKSNSQTSNQINTIPKKQNNLYLLQYQKYFNKKLVIKYNILPNEYILMKLDNFITAKYCHSLASFKEKLIFNYDEEFLNRFYPKKISCKKIPLFSEFYKSYLKFFCFPTLAELRLNDLIEDMVEKKAKAFYNENFSEKKDKNEKKINCIIFTNKIRQDISRINSLTNLTKTTIKNHSNTNKSSVSLLTIEKIFNEMNNEKKINNNNSSKNNLKNNNNSTNKGLKNSVIINKIKKKIKENLREKDSISNSNNISNKLKNNTTTDCGSSGKRKKIKNKISRNLQNKLLENKNKTSNINSQKINTIQKNIHSILKINTKINYAKNIYALLENPKIISNNNNSKIILNEKNKGKEIKNNNNFYNNYCNTLNTNFNYKNNALISNFNNNIRNNNLKIFSSNFIINNMNNKSKNFNFAIHKTISSGNNNNNNKNIKNNTIKVIQKPSIQKIKQIRQIKSRNYKNSINDINFNVNSIYSTQAKNDLILKNISKDNISDYYTINNKNANTISIKISNQKSKPKIKLIKAENKSNNKINNQNNNAKIFNFITSHKKTTNYYIASNFKKDNGSSSSSQKNFIDKNKGTNSNIRKNRVIDSKNHTQVNTNSYVLYDSQKIIKNLKIVTSRENSKNLLNIHKVRISKRSNESPIGKDFKIIKTIKSYFKK